MSNSRENTESASRKSSKKWASRPKSLPEIALPPAPLRDLRGELLGRRVEVVHAPDPGLIGLGGTLVDETLNTLVIEDASGAPRRVAKAHTVFALETPAGRVAVDGDRIRFRPEDRIKKVR